MHCYAVQPEHHLWTVQTTAELTPFSGSVNTALCDFWYAAPQKNTYLLTRGRLLRQSCLALITRPKCL